MGKGHLGFIHVKERDFLEEERQWLNKILSVTFEGRDIIAKQVSDAKVTGCCSCGCKSIEIKVNNMHPVYPYSKRIPVEMEVASKDGVPITFLLHVLNGYVSELEVFRADSLIIDEDINIQKAQVKIN